jgi:hypothetical protein
MTSFFWGAVLGFLWAGILLVRVLPRLQLRQYKKDLIVFGFSLVLTAVFIYSVLQAIHVVP